MQERINKKNLGANQKMGGRDSPWEQAFAALRSLAVAFNKHNTPFHHVIERVLSPDGRVMRAWLTWREASYEYQHAPREVLECVVGNPTLKEIVIYIPGMFDTEIQERMNTLFDYCYPDRKEGLKKEGWIALNWLYSSRDINRTHELELHTLKLAKEHLARGARVRLFAFSLGGIIAKTVADKLVKEYPNQLAVIAHHTPHDPFAGFFVRWAGIQKIHKSLAYSSRHDGGYPIVLLGGEGDAVVPSDQTLHRPDGELITSKSLEESTHQNPLPNESAMRRAAAALRLARMKIPTWQRDNERRPLGSGATIEQKPLRA